MKKLYLVALALGFSCGIGFSVRAQQALPPMGHPWFDSLSQKQKARTIQSIFTVESIGYCFPSVKEDRLISLYERSEVSLDFVKYVRAVNSELGEQVVQYVNSVGGCKNIQRVMVKARSREME